MARVDIDMVDITPLAQLLIPTPVCISWDVYERISELGPKRSWWLMGIVRTLRHYLDNEGDDVMKFSVLVLDRLLPLIATYVSTPEGVTIYIELGRSNNGYC